MSLAKLSTKRPVTITMVTLSIIFIGLIAMFSMRRELLPNIDTPVVTITTVWSGANVEDVENQVTKKIEDILPSIEGINKVETISSYGLSNIVVKFNYGSKTDDKVTEIQKEILNIKDDLPSNAATPLVKKVEAGVGNLTAVVMFSSPNKANLTSFLDKYLKPKLESLKGIGEVQIFGNPVKQLQIQVDSDKLAAYNMTPMELYSLIRTASPSIPVGKISNGNKSTIIKFVSDLTSIEDYENLVISNGDDSVRLKDVANIVLTTEDKENIGFFNGKEAVTLFITKASDGETIKLNKQIFETIDKYKQLMPADTQMSVVLDSSEYITDSISGVGQSAVQGLILATIILFLFLKNARATFLISVALPVSVIFTFAFLALNGTSLNIISLMGLSIGIGMLTDNSVVVIDNIYRHMTELDKTIPESAEEGTNEVTASIIASSLTTMVVFIPILFIPGMGRELFKDLSFSIVFSNLAALFVAITLIPMLASKFLSKNTSIKEEGKIFKKVKAYYLKIVTWAFAHKIKICLITLALFISSIFIAGAGLKFEFMPKQDQGKYSITAELQKGVNLEKAEKLAKEIERIVEKDPSTKTYFTIVKPNVINVNVDIGKKSDRSISVFKVEDRVRKELAGLLDARISLSNSFGSGSSKKEVEFYLQGPDLDQLRTIGKEILTKMQKYPNVVDVSSTLEEGGTELRVNIDRDKLKNYGLNPTILGQTLSYYMLGGDRNHPVTIKTDSDDIDVLVRLTKDKRDDINTLENLKVKVGDFQFIKVGDVAKLQLAESSDEIRKKDKMYTVKIGANANNVGLKTVQDEFVKAFVELNPPETVTYSWGGDSQNMIEVMGQLKLALGISIFLIYALLASQFENFILPIIIIVSMPLSLIGVIFGLVSFRQPMDIMAMIGIILLAGIVVNNAIVLIDFIQLMREKGLSKYDAIITSCETRLRPILMTTMTTVFGMIPLAMGLGEGSEIYKGMALTVIFGLMFSTLLTLVLIPILYSAIDSLVQKILSLFKK